MPEAIDEFSVADFAPKEDEFSIGDFAPQKPIPAADVARDINATIGAGLLPSKILTAPGVAEASAMGQEQGQRERRARSLVVRPPAGRFSDIPETPSAPPLNIAGKVLNEVQQPLEEMAGDFLRRTIWPSYQTGQPIVPPESFGGLPERIQEALIPLPQPLKEARRAVYEKASGLTTPGNAVMLPVAGESKIVQGLFGGAAAEAVPEDIEQLAKARSANEIGRGFGNLAADVGMAALIGKHALKGEPAVAPEVAPERTPTPKPPEPATQTPKENIGVERFVNAIESGQPQGNTLSKKVGLEVTTLDDLKRLLELRKEAQSKGPAALKEALSLMESDPAKAMEKMKESARYTSQGQLASESIMTATNVAQWREGAGGEVDPSTKVQLGPRPLDWKNNPEVAKWLKENAKEANVDVSALEEAAPVAEPKPAVAATEPPKAATPAAAPAVEQAAAKVEAKPAAAPSPAAEAPKAKGIALASDIQIPDLALRFSEWGESGKLEKGNKVLAVGSLEEAASKWEQIRDRTNAGASESPIVTVVNTRTGEEVAKISYNGRIWAPDGSEIKRGNAQPKGIAASVRNKWTSATDDASPALGSEAGFINLDVIRDFVDSVTPHVKNAFLAVKDIARETGHLTRMTDYRRAVLGWSAKLQRSFGEAAAAQREITKAVPNPERRDGITNWIQADGDYALLVRRLNDTAAWRDPVTGKPHPQQKRLIAGYEAALSLTPEEIAVANDARAAYRALGQRGQNYNVLKSFKDNYVTQVWNLARGPQGTGSSRTLKDRFKFSRASTFPTFFDGEQAGYVPKTKDISKLLPVYLHEMNSVIAARQLVQDLSKGVASDGEPLVKPKGVGVPIPATDTSPGATLIMPKASKAGGVKYRTLENQPALSDWRWASTDTAGNPVFLKADLALHPEAYNRIKAVLGRSAIRDWYSTRTSAVAEIPKLLARGLDAANSETKRTMLGFASPFHQVQEGTHALGHRVNPAFNIPKIDLVNDAGQMDAAKHGLMMLPDRASESQFMEGFRPSGIISRIPGIGPISDFYSNYLFHEYIPGIKYKTYQSVLDRNLKVYAKDLAAGKFAPEDVKTLSAEQVNAAFGHLNYADLGRNPTIQHIAQLVLLAPDFLEGRARFAGQAIKGATGAKVGREQLIALAVLAIGQAALAYTSAQLTDGKWDASRPFEFTQGNRRYTMRSVPEDISSLLHNTRLFVHSRLSPLLGKGTLQYLSGVNALGKKVSAGETTKELAEQPIPISVRGFAGIGPSTLSGMEQLAGAVGLKISRFNPEQPKIDAAMKINEFADSIRGEARKLPISQRYQFVKERMAKDKMSVAEQSKVIHKLRQQGTFRYQ